MQKLAEAEVQAEADAVARLLTWRPFRREGAANGSAAFRPSLSCDLTIATVANHSRRPALRGSTPALAAHLRYHMHSCVCCMGLVCCARVRSRRGGAASQNKDSPAAVRTRALYLEWAAALRLAAASAEAGGGGALMLTGPRCGERERCTPPLCVCGSNLRMPAERAASWKQPPL